MEFLSGLSGGALGYIHGNTRGAIKGWKAGRKLYQNRNTMAAPKRKRASKVSTKNKRRTTKSTGTRRKTARTTAAIGNSRAVAKTTNRKQSGVLNKKQRNVKVTKAFREKVKKATEPMHNFGYKQEQQYRLALAPAANQQNHFYTLDGAAGLFSPLRVAHAAAVLFNGKPDSSVPSTDSAYDFGRQNTEITVKKQWVNYTLKNVSLREMTCKVWEIAPRGKMPPSQDPFSTWVSGLSMDMNIDQAVGGVNLNSVSVLFKGLCPTANKHFRNQFNIVEKTIILEAGQTHKWSVQGPAMKYELANYHDGDTNIINELWGVTRWTLVSYHQDLVTQSGFAGVWEDADAPERLLHGLALEAIVHYVIQAPDTTGFSTGITVPGVSQTLDRNKDVYHYATYASGDPVLTAPIHDVNEQNPAGGTQFT